MTRKAKAIVVTFEPHGNRVEVGHGSLIRDAAEAAGIPIDYPCGGRGGCGKCRVRVLGEAEPTSAELAALGREEIAEGWRLACQCRVSRSVTVEVPSTSLRSATYQILQDSGIETAETLSPPVEKRYVELPSPTLADDRPDLERLEAVFGAVEADPGVLRRFPAELRKGDFRGTAVLAGTRLLEFEPGNTVDECYAVAVDVGTTTLVSLLADIATGRALARASRLNPQTRIGDDVLSRILHGGTEEGLRELQGEIIGAINEMIREMADTANAAVKCIYDITLTGNTTMQHLATGLDPSPLGLLPFVPTLRRSIDCPAADIGIRINPRGRAYVFPVIGGFVGGDTVAGILATGIANSKGPTLLVDIGTNGEIVLFHEGRLTAASCAAGPAFEGARIGYGMRAALGAIQRVELDGAVCLDVIGGTAPAGLCGSALIDLAAELLRTGIVTPQGSMADVNAAPDGLPPALRERLRGANGESEFVLVHARDSVSGRDIVFSQQDVRELQLAKGAIRAGINILLRQAGLEAADLDRLLVAGGFGNYIRLANAQRIGLLPQELEPSRVVFAGNTALAGAQMAAASRAARARAEELARQTHHVELSLDPEFHMEFAMAMAFPEG